MGLIRELLCLLLTLYYIVLIVRILLSWVPQVPEPVQPLARGVRALTDPLLTPLRGLLPPLRTGTMAIDFSPILLFVGIAIVRGAIC